MPWDALPDSLNKPSDWIGKDHDKVWYTRWVKYVQGYFAFGPRSKHSWARWRDTPHLIFALKGDGTPFRFEADGQEETPGASDRRLLTRLSNNKLGWYISRVQYWTRWHLAVQWPLQISFHIYWRAADVPRYPIRPTNLGLTKLFFAYGPTHRDADKVYWMPGFFIGGEWK